ncbi:hypothetical protein Mpsy_0352 [Methanolobus psychrophilus R15]|nr:hypothetical protein Mpsy_0352 [Methanolobus psychrophilus R15]
MLPAAGENEVLPATGESDINGFLNMMNESAGILYRMKWFET